jgi:hypothetical protein
MQIYCKRTIFDKENKVLCKKGNIYKTHQPTEFELKSGLCLLVETELPGTGNQIGYPDNWYPLTLKSFKKYFSSIDDMRNNKINDILK